MHQTSEDMTPGGIQTSADIKNVKGAKILSGFVSDISTSELYALLLRNVHRNFIASPCSEPGVGRVEERRHAPATSARGL
jgi:hypothetical protein